MAAASTHAASAASAPAAAASVSAVPPNVGNISFLSTAGGAVCLDGSPAAYYVRYEAERQKIFVYQQGGGWCYSDDDCESRSKTSLGSSTKYPASMDLGSGYLSNDPAQNPMFFNWTKVYLP
jgi:hypothetical protein